MTATLVIGYDGSRDARRAVAATAGLRPRHAIVVNVWHAALAAPTGMLPGPAELPAPGDDERLEQAARAIAEEGVERAREAGLDAEPLVVRGGFAGDIGHALAELAQEHGAAAIVVGRRGISRLEAAVLGSVSNATVREAHCPVFVVPAPDE